MRVSTHILTFTLLASALAFFLPSASSASPHNPDTDWFKDAKYAAAVKHGNPHAIVTFNPGVRVIHYTGAEDYTAGELNDPLEQIPVSRWLDGSQWHALTFVGSSWCRRDTRYTTEQWVSWVRAVTGKEGVVTLDMGPNWDPKAGRIGSFIQAQIDQVITIKAAIR